MIITKAKAVLPGPPCFFLSAPGAHQIDSVPHHHFRSLIPSFMFFYFHFIYIRSGVSVVRFVGGVGYGDNTRISEQ
ncbi:hypothetical protein BDV35DRAFT_357741 [Aspergillus flavus]|uniref:Uncharacterized protein n=1 Tax=Aspergillus flavus TaxID=5059 RepID=A0A5N6GXF1_ASPFL|nr:hypothetical protein BDV35DRAFT_357741 [Aspergillus flavus]